MKDLMKLDLYELLNIKTTASESEIKKAYRKKALTCHPDKNPDDPKADEDFKQLAKAVEILTNDCTRADYDKLFRQRRKKHATIIRFRERAARKAAREKEEAKRKKQYQERKEKEEEKRKGCSYKTDNKSPVPTWPPSASRFAYLSKLDKKRTFPTWPSTSLKSDLYSRSKEETKSSFNFNFTPIVRPATFVAPKCTQFQNLWKGSFRPLNIVKPAKFVAPSNSKNSDGCCDACPKGSSPIIKPATFVAPSMS